MNASTLDCKFPMKLTKIFVFEASNSIIFKIQSNASLCWCDFLIKSHKDNLIGIRLNYYSRLLLNFSCISHYARGGVEGIWFGLLGSSIIPSWFWPFLLNFPYRYIDVPLLLHSPCPKMNIVLPIAPIIDVTHNYKAYFIMGEIDCNAL